MLQKESQKRAREKKRKSEKSKVEKRDIFPNK